MSAGARPAVSSRKDRLTRRRNPAFSRSFPHSQKLPLVLLILLLAVLAGTVPGAGSPEVATAAPLGTRATVNAAPAQPTRIKRFTTAVTATAVDKQAPRTSATLAVTGVSTSSITLSWGAAHDNVGVAGYGLYVNNLRVGTTALRSFTFAGLQCGTTYRVGIDAYDASRNRSKVTSVLAATAPCLDASAPTAPGSVRQSSSGQTGVTLEWTPATDNVGVAGYNVYLDGVPVGVTQQSSLWIGNLVCGAGYSVAVDAFDAVGNRSARVTGFLTTESCSDTAPPSAPGDLVVSRSTATSFSVSWLPSSDDRGVTGYRMSVNGSSYATTTATSMTVSGLSCGASASLALVAFDAAGNTSVASRAIAATATCAAPAGSLDVQAPSSPAGVARTGVSPSSVSLAWNASTDSVGVVGYGVYRDGAKIGDSTSLAYVVSGLACATSYTFAVDAVDAAGNRSPRTPIVAATDPCQDAQSPSAPTGLSSTSTTETTMTLSWQPASDNVGVAGYRIFRGGTQVGSTTSTSYNAIGLTCGTSYTFGVEAFDASGNHSPRPATIFATAPCSDAIAPTAPSSVVKTSATGTSISLSWAAGSDNVAVAGYSLSVAGAVIGTTAQTTYTFAGLTCGSTYVLGVETYDAAGNRSQRASLSATTAPCATPAPPPTAGSLYVSTAGSDANPCTQAQPCLSFGRAYKAAAPGATVLVAAGTYPGQEIDDDPAKPLGGAPVVFAPAAGSVTVNGTLNFGQDQFDRKGPKGVTIRNMSVTYLRAWPGSEGLLWENIDSVHFDLDAKDSTIRGGDYGPCQAPRDDPSCLSRIFGSSSNVLVENSSFHNVTSTDLANYHVDGMAIFGGENITLRSNTFYANMITNIRVQNCCGNVPIRNLVIENNWFALPLQGDGVSTNANGIDVDSTVPGLKLRFNSFAEGSYPQITGAQSDAQMTGNLLTHVSCVAGVAYSYNVFKPWSAVQGQSACSSTDKKVSSLGYSSGGFAIASTSPAIDSVPTSVGCPARDLVGTARPLGLGCDAGASERQ
jgi:chitodextrinase